MGGYGIGSTGPSLGHMAEGPHGDSRGKQEGDRLRRHGAGRDKKGTFIMCDTRLSLLLCRVVLQRRHLPFCRQYPTGTGVAGNCEVRSSRNNVASPVRAAVPDASPDRDSQQHEGREPGSCGLVNSGEAPVNVVMSNQRKLLNRWGQNGTWSSPAVMLSADADGVPPAKRRDLPHTATTTERAKPVVCPAGSPAGKANRKASRIGGG